MTTAVEANDSQTASTWLRPQESKHNSQRNHGIAINPRGAQDFTRVPLHAASAQTIQTKRAGDNADDIHEKEADRISEDVVSGASRGHELLEAKPASGKIGQAVPPSVNKVLATPGDSLNHTIQGAMEQRFGHDFSQVRVHSAKAANQSAHDMNSRAYTVGNDIVFGQGQYSPNTVSGQRLIAHELVHTIQQGGQRGAALQRKPIPVIEQKRQTLDLTPTKTTEEDPASEEIIDPFVTSVDETRIFNQDERFNEYRKVEYGEGWINIGGGKQQKVQFKTETVTHTPSDSWEKGWSTKNTQTWVTEKETRTARTPFHVESVKRTRTEDIVNVPKHKIPPKKSLGMRALAKFGGFFKGLGESAWGLVEGVYHVIRHPIQTVEGIGHILRHPIRTLEALGHAIKSRGAAILSGDTEALGKTIGDIAILLLAPEAEGAEAAKALEGVDAAKALDAADAVKALDAADAAKVTEAEAAGVKAVKEAESGGRVADEAGAATKGGKGPETDIRGVVEENRDIRIRGEEDVAEAVKGGRTRRTQRGSRVETVERDIEKAERRIKHKSTEIAEEKRLLGERVQSEYMPEDTKVTTVQTERTSAGRGQSRAVTPEESPVGMDVEFRVDLPDSSRTKLGLPRRDPVHPQRGTIKFDGIEPQGSKFKILEHKEVESIWDRSHFGRDRALAEREIDEILNRHIGICDEIPKCSGVTFSSNEARLVELINERISILPKSVRSRVSFVAEVR